MADTILTLRELLWDTGVSAGIALCLTQAVKSAGKLGGVATVPLEAVINEAAAALHEALDVSLGDILATAWTDSRKIRDAADPEMHGPDEVVIVPLLEHAIRSEHKPTLEFTVDGRSLFSLVFVVELALQLQQVVLRIKAGRIRSVVGGSCHASATLSCGGAELVRRDTRDIALPLCVDLGEGILVLSRGHASAPLMTAEVAATLAKDFR